MSTDTFGGRTPRVPSAISTPLWFLSAGLLTGSVFIAVTNWVWPYNMDALKYPVLAVVLGISTLGGVPAARMAPDQFVDRFQKLGVYFAMLVPVNVVMSVGLILFEMWRTPGGGNLSVPLADIVFQLALIFAASSVFLPAPYAGVILGFWLSRR